MLHKKMMLLSKISFLKDKSNNSDENWRHIGMKGMEKILEVMMKLSGFVMQ
jgi:hypothetical protein